MPTENQLLARQLRIELLQSLGRHDEVRDLPPLPELTEEELAEDSETEWAPAYLATHPLDIHGGAPRTHGFSVSVTGPRWFRSLIRAGASIDAFITAVFNPRQIALRLATARDLERASVMQLEILQKQLVDERKRSGRQLHEIEQRLYEQRARHLQAVGLVGEASSQAGADPVARADMDFVAEQLFRAAGTTYSVQLLLRDARESLREQKGAASRASQELDLLLRDADEVTTLALRQTDKYRINPLAESLGSTVDITEQALTAVLLLGERLPESKVSGYRESLADSRLMINAALHRLESAYTRAVERAAQRQAKDDDSSAQVHAHDDHRPSHRG